MADPEFLICNECESPCYTFDWDDRNLRSTEAVCCTCGNDVPEAFDTEDEYCEDS